MCYIPTLPDSLTGGDRKVPAPPIATGQNQVHGSGLAEPTAPSILSPRGESVPVPPVGRNFYGPED